MMRIFTESDNFTSTMLWKHCLMIMGIAVLTTNIGWAKSMHSESLYGQENDGTRPFITIWKTDNPGASQDNQIIIPTDQSEDLALVYNYNVYWEEVDNPMNNGSLEGLTDNDTLGFPSPGVYKVEITGQFPKIFFNNEGDRSKILAVEQWGDIVWEDMGYSFYGCDNIAIDAFDAPDLSIVTNMSGMFRASSINQSINHWDVSNVTNMGNLFRNAADFNQDLNNWNVGNVIAMNHMFMGATNFNKDIGSWNLNSVNATRSMFYQASSFDQYIGDWDVSKVTSMASMFREATNFDQDLSLWDVRNVDSFNSMFYAATNFNQDIKSWDVSEATDMTYMFAHATAFNQSIDLWDVSKVNTMSFMFYNASAFNQPLSNWDVGNVTAMANMFDLTSISPVNFELTLQGWLEKDVKDNIVLGANGLQYCKETGAIKDLITNHSWEIKGATKNCSQEITFLALSDKVYGDDDFALVGSVSSGNTPLYSSSDEGVATINGNIVTITGAGTTIITASQPGDGDYNLASPVNRNFTVLAANQTITFDPIPSKVIGDDDFDLVATVDSGLEITFVSSDESVAKVVGNTVTVMGAGTTVITALQEGNLNYNSAMPVEQELQISKKSQTIIFDALPSKTILDDDFNLTASSTSGLDVVYTSSNELVAAVAGNKVTIVGLGTTTITASQAGNAEYAVAPDVSRELVITKVPQQITFEPIVDRFADAPNFEIIASASSGLPIVFTVNGPAAIEGNEISLKGTPGIVSVTATQGGNDIYSNAEPVVRTFEVLAAPVTGVQDLHKEGISIYPNPVYDRLTIDLAKTNQAVIYVSDAGGNIVLEDRLVSASNQVDVSSLSSGLYFIKIQLEDKVLYHKVMKE